MADGIRYVSRTGGVLLHLEDGSSEAYGYGQEVRLDELAPHQRENINDFTSEDPRTEIGVGQSTRENPTDAERPQSVPKDYDELDENAAIGVVRNADDLATEADILEWEMLHANRRKVLDAAQAEAVQIAKARVSAQQKKQEHQGKRSPGPRRPRQNKTPDPIS